MKDLLEAVKTALQIVVFVIIGGALVLLIFWPNSFAVRGKHVLSALENEGLVAKAKFGGIEIALAKEELTEADQRIAKLQEAALCIERDSCTQANFDVIAGLLGLKAAQDRSVSATQIMSVDNPWIVVAGADKTLGQALPQLGLITRAGYDGKLLEIDGWIRTVAVFASRNEAEAKVGEIDRLVGNRGVYVRALYQWCSKVRDSSLGNGVLACDKSW